MGAINFGAADIYGATGFTTESTIPEAEDQNALVDTQNAGAGETNEAKKTPIYLAFLLIAIIALVLGVIAR